MSQRTGRYKRETKETAISISIRLDEQNDSGIETPLPFLNHMLDAFSCHGRFGLDIKANGDIEVDPHHLIEDCGIVLGKALKDALDEFKGIARAGCFDFPMDGSLARVAIDLCGRPNLVWNVDLGGYRIGTLDPRLFRDFFKGLADGLLATIHVNVPYLDNEHHAVEAIFKAFARALREAVTQLNSFDIISTKGKIDD